LVTEAGTKRRSASRANSVWPLDRSTSSAIGISSGTGAAVTDCNTIGLAGAAHGIDGTAARASANADPAKNTCFKIAPRTRAAGPERSESRAQPLV